MVHWTEVDDASNPAGPTLPADRTFVVQFRASPAAPEEGRVEHLVTGSAMKFASWDELRQFVEHVLLAERNRA